jgi:hypothetical protein
LLKVALNTKKHHQIILMILLIPTSVRPAKLLVHGRWFSPSTQASSTMVVLNAVDSEIAPQLGKAKEYEIGICNFFAEHTSVNSED